MKRSVFYFFVDTGAKIRVTSEREITAHRASPEGHLESEVVEWGRGGRCRAAVRCLGTQAYGDARLNVHDLIPAST